MLKRISYPINPQSPLYPGTPEFVCSKEKSIEKGDNSNTTILTFSSHTGTHIDAPHHFCPGGKTTREVLGNSLTLSPVYCIDFPKDSATPIRILDLEPHIWKMPGAKGILMRTGMSRFHSSDPKRYCRDHPWIHPEVPEFLRSTCPSLILFGTDTISISNPQFRPEGRECHRQFLCGARPILLAEDLDLSDPALVTGPFSVTFYPWIIDNLDGVPVLAFAELR